MSLLSWRGQRSTLHPEHNEPDETCLLRVQLGIGYVKRHEQTHGFLGGGAFRICTSN